MYNLVSLASERHGKPELAEYLRELAERAENGDIGNIVIVFDDVGEGCYERHANFEDRWLLLGALEYAKDAIHASF